MKIEIPEVCLVALVGASGSGKTTFARRHFAPTEILSSDVFRGLVSDDPTDQSATDDAFEALHYIAGKRLARGRLTVIDATNLHPGGREALVQLARAHHLRATAIVLDLGREVCQERNAERATGAVRPRVIKRQADQLRGLRGRLKREGFRGVHVLKTPEAVDAAVIERARLKVNRRDEAGPFDIIGDVHGCFEELVALLGALGYAVEGGREAPVVTPPEGRKALFLGDLVDRGPDSPGVLRLVMGMVEAGTALCLLGNHEAKLQRKLQGRNVKLAHGLEETAAQMALEPESFHQAVAAFIEGLPHHLVLDEGRLVVAHAGMREGLQGRVSGQVRAFALYGETTGETDDLGLPIRLDWAKAYRGEACVVYGHTPVREASWLNRTICLDTGCAFGGALTALRYPERALVSVPAVAEHYAPNTPFLSEARSPQRDDLFDLLDVAGERRIQTRLYREVTVRADQATAALETMSRFAVDPRWLIYLPPTMSPSETATEEGYLEHPQQAFEYYKRRGVTRVICEEKHMGSRAIVVVCKEAGVPERRFGIADGRMGRVYTRTGRAFFKDDALEVALLERLRAALEASGFWARFDTDWACLDAELMPWSLKAQDLLRTQYAAVGSASKHALTEVTAALRMATERGVDAGALLASYEDRAEATAAFTEAYRQYCWPTSGIDDLKLAPFHLLATEGEVHTDQDHAWHMDELARICAADEGLLLATPYKALDLDDEAAVAEGTRWWLEHTARGGEGMVVKPLSWLAYGARGLLQPAIKCRGRAYLRIIYGPEYTTPRHLERLRKRGLGAKRSLALRELALGLEGLHRFVDKEPLYRVHECVFGVLAMESTPVDPRL